MYDVSESVSVSYPDTTARKVSVLYLDTESGEVCVSYLDTFKKYLWTPLSGLIWMFIYPCLSFRFRQGSGIKLKPQYVSFKNWLTDPLH